MNIFEDGSFEVKADYVECVETLECAKCPHFDPDYNEKFLKEFEEKYGEFNASLKDSACKLFLSYSYGCDLGRKGHSNNGCFIAGYRIYRFPNDFEECLLDTNGRMTFSCKEGAGELIIVDKHKKLYSEYLEANKEDKENESSVETL